jgi:hypothetical protein
MIENCQHPIPINIKGGAASVYRVFLHYHGKTSKFEAMKSDYGVVYDLAAVA